MIVVFPVHTHLLFLVVHSHNSDVESTHEILEFIIVYNIYLYERSNDINDPKYVSCGTAF